MECVCCKVGFTTKMLFRTNPVGQSDAGWMCEKCIKNKEPELYQNMKSDGEFSDASDIMDAIKQTFG